MSLYVTAFDGMGSGEDSVAGALQNLAGIEASDIMHIANDFINQEGVVSIDDGDFEVTAAGTDMNVDVAVGIGYVENDAWSRATSVTRFWRVESDEIEEVTLDAADASLHRIDIIILQINDAASADDEASNVATVTKVTGTPDASPSAPSVPDDALILAEVYVSASVTTISNGDITDSRVQSSLLPILENEEYLQGENAAGTAKKLIGINSSDELHVGEDNELDHTVINAGSNKLVKVKVLRQNNTTNVYQKNSVILAGFGALAGDDTNDEIEETVTFGITFSSAPIVVISGAGGTATSNGNPDDPTDLASNAIFGGDGIGGIRVWESYAFTTSSFKARGARNGGVYGSTFYYCYTWIAIGVLN